MKDQETELKNLLLHLQEQASDLLNAAGIYSVTSYAWEGEDTPSNDYLGLAIWSTDAPLGRRIEGEHAKMLKEANVARLGKDVEIQRQA